MEYLPSPTVSVIICAYTAERWDWLLDVIESLRGQTLAPKEVIVVIDHNEELYERLAKTADDITVARNTGPRGLSGARNTGVGLADSDVVAFLDDDAVAAPDWLERLMALYDDPEVLGVGGRVEPLWEAGRPVSLAKSSTGLSAAATGACHGWHPKFETSSVPTCPSGLM
ncbi:glycosyltransferase family 2 protein [Arthrobacter sp. SD76]|uniref:glycosyltransferase family 2 protein n=1 Tax=Arthrobacter sp. SD76 TaxID=3415007 RepID=UPI003C73DBD5